MNFDRYIDNPSGGAVFTNRSMYKKMYSDKFDKILVREQGRIHYTIYKVDDAQDTYYLHFKIPSEVIDHFYYDVVIKLYTTDNRMKTNANLRSYNVQFFSNDPAFVYTFAHTFHSRGLFIEELKLKMVKRAIKDEAKEKNPNNNVWYVKSLFFAYIAMERYGLFNRSMLNQRSKKYKKRDLLNSITPADIKIKDRQHEQEELSKRNKQEKERKRRELQQQARLRNNTNKRSTKISPTVRSTKSTRTTRTTRNTKII